MKLDDFENFIEDKILDRGQSYYRNGYIDEVEEVEEGEYNATVSGSSEYTVNICLNEYGTVYHHDCDCPYDWGNFCKHEAAVLYYIRANKNTFKKAGKTGTIQAIKEELQLCDASELRALVVNLAKQSKDFRNQIREELGLEE